MLCVAIETARPQHPFMSTDETGDAELKLLGRALANLRGRTGMSQDAAGEAVGMSGPGWGLYELGKRKGLFRPAMQARLAAALNSNADELRAEVERLAANDPGVAPLRPQMASAPETSDESAMLEIRGRVQAGAWLATDDVFNQAEPKRYPLARDPRYKHARQWLSEVLGDSMNLLGINERDLVHVIDLSTSGLWPKTGDIVEVERVRFAGQEIELTLKQVEVTPKGMILWPRSTNPRWANPLDLREGAKQDEHVEVRVRGIVVASVRRF